MRKLFAAIILTAACLCAILTSCSSLPSSSSASSGSASSGSAQSNVSSSVDSNTSASMVSPASGSVSTSNSASSADALAVMSEIDSDADSLAALYPDVPHPILVKVAAMNLPMVNSVFTVDMVAHATAHDSTLVYTFKLLLDDITVDAAKQLARNSVYPTTVQELKDDGVANPVLQCYWYDKNGKLLYSQEYK